MRREGKETVGRSIVTRSARMLPWIAAAFTRGRGCHPKLLLSSSLVNIASATCTCLHILLSPEMEVGAVVCELSLPPLPTICHFYLPSFLNCHCCLLKALNLMFIQNFIASLHASFAIHDLGHAHFFLGIELILNSDGYILSQSKTILSLF